jgi:hypothetical protein
MFSSVGVGYRNDEVLAVDLVIRSSDTSIHSMYGVDTPDGQARAAQTSATLFLFFPFVIFLLCLLV